MSQADSPQIMEGRSEGRGEQILSMRLLDPSRGSLADKATRDDPVVEIM